VSEFKIPFSIFPELEDAIGFAAAAYAGNSTSFRLAIWPEPYYRDIPNTWGELTVSSEPIPEFEIVPFVMVIGIIATLVILKHRKI
jgi:hypothetical protein